MTAPRAVRASERPLPAYGHLLGRAGRAWAIPGLRASPRSWIVTLEAGLRLGRLGCKPGVGGGQSYPCSEGGPWPRWPGCPLSQVWVGLRVAPARRKVPGPGGLRAHLSQVWVGLKSPLLRGKVPALVPRVPRVRARAGGLSSVSGRPKERGHRGAMRRGTRGPSREGQQTPSHMTGGGAWTERLYAVTRPRVA